MHIAVVIPVYIAILAQHGFQLQHCIAEVHIRGHHNNRLSERSSGQSTIKVQYSCDDITAFSYFLTQSHARDVPFRTGCQMDN